MLFSKGNDKDGLFARKRLGAIAPLPWVAEMAEFSRNIFLDAITVEVEEEWWNSRRMGAEHRFARWCGICRRLSDENSAEILQIA